ncbi:MAG TPA: hypothetical protein VFS88_04975, partial [Micavibrio sp.]|nr:hypothetical protein [Micavibrio sp.]
MSSILEMTTTDWVAVYGAVLSTITAVAGGIGWFFRHRIILTHSINMELSDGSGVTYITFEVTNRGSIPTQVTHLHGYYYKSHWERIFFSKRRRSFIVSDNHIPKTIDPGAYWIFFAKQ